MDYNKSPLATKYSPLLAWEAQARTHRSQTKIISSSYLSIERASQALGILWGQRKAAHDPSLPADISELRQSLSMGLTAVCKAISGHTATVQGRGATSSVHDVIDTMGDCFIHAFSLRTASRQQSEDPHEVSMGSTPAVVLPTHTASAPAAAVSSSTRRREQRHAMENKRQ